MNKKLSRQFTIAQSIPLYPDKLSSAQIQQALADSGAFFSRRTIQRDLMEMSQIDFFGLLCDQRSKPHGWTKLNIKSLSLDSAMPLSLVVAIQVWSTVAINILPSKIEGDLMPLIKYTSIVLSKNPTLNNKVNEVITLAQSKFIPQDAISKSVYDELWHKS